MIASSGGDRRTALSARKSQMPTTETFTTNGHEIPIVVMRGTPRDCGVQYGRAAASMIRGSLEAYLESFRVLHGLDREAIFEIARKFEPVIAEFDPATREEMAGIAEGAEVPLEAVLTINARSELVHGLKARLDDGCTSFAVFGDATADGHTYVGQNWDWSPAMKPYAVVLDIQRDGDPRILTLTEAGLVGKHGLNDAGIGICNNFMLSDKRRFGMPVHVIRRKALTARLLSEAMGTVLNAEKALAANYLMGHAEGAAVNLEAWPGGVDVIHPDEDLITHANHFQISRPERLDIGRNIFPDSLLRDVRLRRRLLALHGRIDLAVLADAMSDHLNYPDSICRHMNPRASAGQSIETLGCIIMDVTEGILHFCSGPPCEGEFAAIALDRKPGQIAVARYRKAA
jgi:isopenicillin-N N-acyltransferase-like protein